MRLLSFALVVGALGLATIPSKANAGGGQERGSGYNFGFGTIGSVGQTSGGCCTLSAREKHRVEIRKPYSPGGYSFGGTGGFGGTISGGCCTSVTGDSSKGEGTPSRPAAKKQGGFSFGGTGVSAGTTGGGCCEDVIAPKADAQ